MTQKMLYIEKYDWDILFYINISKDDKEQVVSVLKGMGCSFDLLEKIKTLIVINKLNTGFTFSKDRLSFVVIAPTTMFRLTVNSLTHEIRHVVDDIADYYKIDLNGEDVAYLTGEITMLLYDFLECFLIKS